MKNEPNPDYVDAQYKMAGAQSVPSGLSFPNPANTFIRYTLVRNLDGTFTARSGDRSDTGTTPEEAVEKLIGPLP